VDQRAELGGVVVLVAVVHDHRVGQVLDHERFEGVHGAVTDQVVGVELGGGHQQVPLGLLLARQRLARADPQWGFIAAHRVGEGDQRPGPLVHVGEQPRRAVDHAVREPHRRCRAGQRLQ
jgi:hypothetical protein